MLKRETVFPGSSGWATATRSSPTSEADAQVSAAPSWAPNLRKNPRAPRIDLPINPVHPDSQQPSPVVDGPPWKHYKTAFGLELGGYVAIVCKVPATDRLFSMYSVSGPGRQGKIEMLRSLKHENLLTPEEIFTHEDSSYIITEYAAISLEDLVLVRPDEAQLAAIVGQVMHGICYLASKSLSHGSLTSANILLTTKGVVKIESCDNCSSASTETQLVDARALGRVMCELMGEKAEAGAATNRPSGGPLRLKDPTNWSAEAVDFLGLTLSTPVQKLVNHRFLRQPCSMNDLIPLVEFAIMSSCRFYDLQNSFMRSRTD